MMNDINRFKENIRNYFKRLSIIVTQVPTDLRALLLPRYMLYRGYKSSLYVDSEGKIAFEVKREIGSRMSIKTIISKKHVEDEVFGLLGQENMFKIEGKSKLERIVLTSKDFAERYRYKLPRTASILTFSKEGYIGPIEIGKNAELKLIEVSIYWTTKGKNFIKHIPFAWIFGNTDLFLKVNPLEQADSDFYSSLINMLYFIITHGYEKLVDKDTNLRVIKFYLKLLEKIKQDFKERLSLTQADEYVFQKLLERYKIFLYPRAKIIESQYTIKGKITRRPDFYIQGSEDERIYVEIEPPFYKPFKDFKLTNRLKGALKQISEWRKIMPKDDKCKKINYFIIIGLLEELSVREKKALTEFNEKQKDLVVVTWDHIIENINSLEQETKKLLSRNI